MTSSEIPESRPRTYRKHRRAELEEQTRERITEAAVELHGSVGPAQTTITAIAELAGVQRATVYRHFPDEASLFAACSQHWGERNPLPDLGGWGRIADPDARLRVALGELYAWYGRTEQMLDRTTRDASLVPAMQAPLEARRAYTAAAVDVLLRGRGERGQARRRARAAIGHAVTFETWQSLVRREGLTDPQAVELMAGMVED